jgi:competence protein ComEA
VNGIVKWCCAAGIAAMFCAAAMAQTATADTADQKRLKRICGGCHPVAIVTTHRASREEWRQTIHKMIDKGLDAPEDDLEWVFDYLAENYGPAKGGAAAAKLNINKANAGQIARELGLSYADAATIVNYREANGHFKDWQELTKVPGIDLKKLEANKDRVEF